MKSLDKSFKISFLSLACLLILLPIILLSLNKETNLKPGAVSNGYPWGYGFNKYTSGPIFEDTSVRSTIVKSLLTDINDQSKTPIRFPHPTLGGNKYWMAYASVGDVGKISYAYSDDLLTWKKYEKNPVLNTSAGELYLSSPNLFKDGDYYYLVFDAGIYLTATTETQKLSYARSSTPFGPWTRGSYILNVGNSNEWDRGRVTEPGIFKDNGVYYLFYMGDLSSGGSGEQVAVATTPEANFPNGPWTKQGIMLPIGQSSTAWDRGLTADPNVLKVGNTFYMLYTGSYGNENWKMGIATATNLLGPWTRPTSPILVPGPSTWDNNSLVRGGLYYNQGKFYLYYSGFGSSTNRFTVGLAIGDPLLTPTPPPHSCPNSDTNCVNRAYSCPAGTVDDPGGMCGLEFRCCNPNLTPVPTNTPTVNPSLTPTSTPSPYPPNAILVNAGGPAYTDAGGNQWLADSGFVGGQRYSVSNNVAGTVDQTLYRTERYGMSGYQFNVVNGTYNVTLKFAEIYNGCYSANCRVFNVDIEGRRVLSNFDIYAWAGGSNKAFDQTFTVTVNDGILNINFSAIKENPKVNAIKIVPANPNTAIRINAGGPSYTDASGNQWLADSGFIGGQLYSVFNNITGTADPTLYKSERYSMSGYQFDVVNGTYNVTLKFAEIYTGCYLANCRVFNVNIEGNPVLSNFDIFTQAGGSNKALDKTFTVTVNDGKLNINFSQIKENPKVNAIQIIPAQ